MNTSQYRTVCQEGDVFRRETLEDTIRALAGLECDLLGPVRKALAGDPVDKPEEHNGGPDSNWFRVKMSSDEAQAIEDALRDLEISNIDINERDAVRYADLADRWYICGECLTNREDIAQAEADAAGYKFEDYKVYTGYTNVGKYPIAFIKEFFALSRHGNTHEEAIANLRSAFDERVAQMRESGEPIPRPGGLAQRGKFAPTEKVEGVWRFAAEFWAEILGASFRRSFVSDASVFEAWEHYVGGRENLISKVRDQYSVDITDVYDQPIAWILAEVERNRGLKRIRAGMPAVVRLVRTPADRRWWQVW